MQPLYVPARIHWLLGVLLIGVILAAGCTGPGAPVVQPDAGILFWHDWTGGDAALLSELIDNYQELHPDITIIDVPVAPGDVDQRDAAQEFAARFAEGTEPDLILTDARVAQELIRRGLAKELSSLVAKPGVYSSAALSTVSDGGSIYALPFALSTQMLFYNKSQVSAAPLTLSDLRQLISQPDIAMGLNTSFMEAYWGLRAFGGRSYDSAGNFTLNRGALTNWLTALTSIQGAAGFVLSSDQDYLRRQFLNGDIALYVGDAAEVGELAAVLGDQLGVAPLPHGVNDDPAGPLLQVSALLISANADENETARALEFAEFLTNSQQQSLLAFSDTGRWAAVNTVYLSPTMPDVVVQLATQLSSAVPVTLAQRPVWDEVAERGQTLYRSVLEGALDEQEAAGQLVDYVDGLRQDGTTPAAAVDCPQLTATDALTLTVWHSWSDTETAVLEQVAGEFHNHCPQVAISLTRIGNSTTLNQRYRAATAAGGGPDVLIGSTQWMALLAQDGLIRSLDNDLAPGELAAFIPAAVRAVQVDSRIYLYPESVRSVALIYNPTLVATPPKTLHDLLLQVDSEHALAMPLTFFYAYWGLGAFGGNLVDANGTLQFDQADAAAWLQWLHDAARRPGFLFTTGRAEAEYAFLQRDAAYLISGPWSLPRLQAALPTDEIDIALLPSGPVNRASPMLEVEGVMLNATAQEETAAAGLAFARYLSSTASGQALIQTGAHVPANVTVELADTPLIGILSEQAQLADGVVQDRRWQPVFAKGDILYRTAIRGEVDIAAAVAAFAAAIQQDQETEP